MIVLDASAAGELVLGSRLGAAVRERIAGSWQSLHGPHLLDVEVVSALRRYLLSAELSESRAPEALEDFRALGIARYPHDVLLSRVWELRRTVSAYDAASLALAEALGAPLLTCDRRLARALGHRARVELAAC